jgi:hypothetical protein
MARSTVVSKRMLAAGIIIQRLKRGRGRADTPALVEALARHNLNGRYLGIGVRYIRDMYGDNALVVEHQSKGSPVYVLDPQKFEQARKWAIKMFKRALTETRHVIQVLEWSRQNGIATASVKRAKHYATNVEVELENVLSTL